MENLAKIILARHCRTKWNIEKRLVGISEIPLSPEGLQEAHDTAHKLKSLGLDLIITSPLKRAQQTAEIYSQYLDIPLITEPGLREIDHGDWNGIKIDELLNNKSSAFVQWYDDPTSIPIPNGTESILDAQKRIRQTIKNILLEYSGKTVLVVMHKHIRSILNCTLEGKHLKNFRQNIDDSVLPIKLSEDLLIKVYGSELNK